MRKALIDSHLTKLHDSFGATQPPVDCDQLEHLFRLRDIAGMLVCIAKTLHVHARLRLGIVDSGGPPTAPAWVSHTCNLAPYGTEAFRQTLVTVYVRRTFLQESDFDTVAAAIAHELSHVILNSTGHPLRKHEEAVDLTAMILGFRDIFVTGCHNTLRLDKDTVVDIRRGYLSREELMYAARAMTCL
ncbi:hypothetical protein FJY94_01640 [Candidatus Kaiserbacteria bacterium]|nr:hypothetical protein [Candidatus Kaiserbacteria bacterium]